MRTEITSEDLTPEDREIWLALIGPDHLGKPGRLYHLIALWSSSASSDDRDYRQMLWIASQANWAWKQEYRYGRGKRLRSVHPLARIGMSL